MKTVFEISNLIQTLRQQTKNDGYAVGVNPDGSLVVEWTDYESDPVYVAGPFSIDGLREWVSA